jgi:hypothetical protein
VAVGPCVSEIALETAAEPDQFPGGRLGKVPVSRKPVTVHVVAQLAVGDVVPAEVGSPLPLAIAALVDKTLGLRATREAELGGIDEPEHAETAYDHGRFTTRQSALAGQAHELR